jgi:acylphosphatase
MMTENHQLHAIVHGHVQGVSFRYNTLVKANELKLTGWVRNLPDRTVETTAQGPRDVLEVFLKWLRQGPPGSRVIQVDAEWSLASGKFDGFDIR